MKSRHIDTGCLQGRIGMESTLASRACLYGPFLSLREWVVREVRSWGSLEYLAATYCLLAVLAAWFGGK